MATVAELQQTIASLRTQLAQVNASIANPVTLPVVVTVLNAENARLQVHNVMHKCSISTTV